jgi:IS4 transposase
VELFFKWIKQHLRIKRFVGNSENAVKTQIWCAIAKKELQIDASLYTLLQILSVSIFEKTQLQQAFTGTSNTSEQTDLDNQLNLFEF